MCLYSSLRHPKNPYLKYTMRNILSNRHVITECLFRSDRKITISGDSYHNPLQKQVFEGTADISDNWPWNKYTSFE